MPLVPDSLRTLAYAMIVGALVICGLVLGRELLVPLVIGTVLAFILAPIVEAMQRRGVPRGIAATILIGGLIVALSGLFTVFSAQLLSLAADMSLYTDNIVRKVRDVSGYGGGEGVVSRASRSLDVIERAIRRELAAGGVVPIGTETSPGGRVSKDDAFAGMGLRDVLQPLTSMALTIVFTTFLLIQFQDLRDRIVRVAGTDNLSKTSAALSEAAERLSHLFAMQAILNVAFGVIIGLALTAIGVPNAVLWGVATALLRFVPFIGSILAVIPPLVLAAGVSPGWTMVLETLVLFVVGEIVISQLVEPKLLGKSAGLSPLAFILAASFWTLVWGPAGLILAAPLTMLVVVAGQFLPQLEFVSVLLGNAPPLTPAQQFYHRLVSDDAVAAWAQFQAAADATSDVQAAEDLVLPALQLATIDARIGRIDDARVRACGDAFGEFLDLVAADATTQEPTTQMMAQHQVAVVAARGPLDEMAARIVAQLLNSEIGVKVCAPAKGSGLTALGATKDTMLASQTGTVVIVSAGDAEGPYLGIVERRARATLPAWEILVCRAAADLADIENAGTSRAQVQSPVLPLRSVAELLAARFDRTGGPQATVSTSPAVATSNAA